MTDENGNDRPWETDSEDDWLTVTSHADDYLHGAQTYVITYTVENVTWFFPSTDTTEFYWDVNGVGWQQPFGDVSATLHVAPDIAADLAVLTSTVVDSVDGGLASDAEVAPV